MKKLLPLSIFILFSLSIFSQNIGVKAGFLVSKISQTSSMFGGTAGLFFQTKGNIYFVAEANFKSINGSVMVPVLNITNTKTGEKKKVYSHYFIEMPLMVGMGNINAKKGSIRPFINIGASPAVIIGSRYDKKSYSEKDNFNLSFVVSPGIMMSDKVSIEARLNKSVVGLDYSSFSFLLGFRF